MGKQKQGKGIAWTEQTWNPVRGCTRVSQGCVNCYAERIAARFSGAGQPYEGLATTKMVKANGGYVAEARWTGKVKFIEERLLDPLRWARPRMVFVNSMSDLFHETLPFEQVDRIFAVMALAGKHTFQCLTKRAERMREYFEYNPTGAMADVTHERVAREAKRIAAKRGEDVSNLYWDLFLEDWPLRNVWLGVSAEDQETWDERVPELIRTPAAAEPLIGPIMMYGCLGKLDWIVAGGESGTRARSMLNQWAVDLRKHCDGADVAFFMKQLSEADRPHDFKLFESFPVELRVREYPDAIDEHKT